jgi:peptidase M23B
MINGAEIRITGKKVQYDIEKIAGIMVITILLFSILFQINQIISINSGYFEEEITENIEEKLMNTVNTEEKKLSEIKAEEIAKDEKINKIEKVQEIIKITGEEIADSKGNRIIKIKDTPTYINTNENLKNINGLNKKNYKSGIKENVIENINVKNITDNQEVQRIQNIQNIQNENINNKNFGKILWPVKSGRITSKFGNRNHPVLKSVKFHRGVDIAVSLGTPVYAGIKGIVTFAGKRGNYGNLVEIEGSDGIKVRYAHLSKIDVVTGQKVLDGEKVAETGNTGMSTGPHLHYEIIVDDSPVNPLNFHD